MNSNLTISMVFMRILSVVFIVFFILPLHELAHGWVAYKLGDKTAKYNGRLTINPLAHLDPMGAFCILLFGFGWARPVPVDPRNFRKPKYGMALTAAAGPMSNIVAALIGAFLYYGILALFKNSINTMGFSLLQSFFGSYISINIGLAVFNLIPVPPLDGSKILESFLPDKILNKYYQNQMAITMILFILLLFGVFSVPLRFLQNNIFMLIMNFASLPFQGLFSTLNSFM